jgi:hypothetical protein
MQSIVVHIIDAGVNSCDCLSISYIQTDDKVSMSACKQIGVSVSSK